MKLFRAEKLLQSIVLIRAGNCKWPTMVDTLSLTLESFKSFTVFF